MFGPGNTLQTPNEYNSSSEAMPENTKKKNPTVAFVSRGLEDDDRLKIPQYIINHHTI